MTSRHPVVFLVDVDNPLIDNDRLAADLICPRPGDAAQGASARGPLLLKTIQVTLAWLRDAVLRTAVLPADPNWEVLSRQADDVVRFDLVTVSAVADWLDGIEDEPTVHAFILCRRVLFALLNEYHEAIIRRCNTRRAMGRNRH